MFFQSEIPHTLVSLKLTDKPPLELQGQFSLLRIVILQYGYPTSTFSLEEIHKQSLDL